MKKRLLTQLSLLLLFTSMVFGEYGPELIHDAGNENGEIKSAHRHYGNSALWKGSFSMTRGHNGSTYLLTGNERLAYTYQAFPTDIGESYEVKATLVGADTSRNGNFVAGSIVAIANQVPTAHGSNEIALSKTATGSTPTEVIFTFTAISTNSYVVLRGDTSWKYPNLSSVSVKKIDGTTPPVQDTQAPTITLNGANPQILTMGDAYIELGATVSDNVDTNLMANIDASRVDTSTVGTYVVTYDVNDTTGNQALQVSRTVVVNEEPTIPPVTGTNFILGVNLNGGAVNIEGNLWKSEAQALQSGLRFSETPLAYVTRLNPTPDVDSDTSTMLNSVHWTRGDWSVQQTLPNGEYDVYVWIMENYRSNVRELDIEIENTSVAQDIGTLARGNWTKYGPYSTGVEDGVLDIKLLKGRGDAHMMGFSVFNSAPPSEADTTPPTLTLNGENPQALTVGFSYVELGATATDNVDGNITGSIKSTSNVDTSIVGTYTVTYDVNDTAGNQAIQVSRTVIVNEKATCTQNTNIIKDGTFENKSTYVAWIKTSGDARIVRKSYNGATGTSLNGNGGKYVLRAKGGETVTAEQTIDIAPCVGENVSYDFRAELGGYGDGDTIEVKVLFKNSNNQIVSTYTTEAFTSRRVMTEFTNKANVPSDASQVTVQLTFNRVKGKNIDGYVDNLSLVIKEGTIVEDTTPPTLTLLGTNPVNLIVGTTYTDAGATATDERDGNVTANIVTTSTVDTSTAGTYLVTYDVNDTAGNNAEQITRTVNVALPADVGAPTLTLLGTNPVNLIVGTTYTDAGATATDERDGNVTANIVTTSTVDTTIAGTYLVTYDVNDTAGNNAQQITRTVNVALPADTEAPVISLIGEETVTITEGERYPDAGATATDNIDGDISAYIVTVNPVDFRTAGTYTVTYDINDSVGNQATQVTRTVVVTAIANTPPIAVATVTPSTTTEGEVISFDASGSTDSDGSIDAYEWKEGSVVLSTALDFTKSDFAVGTHTVTLTVTDDDGATHADDVVVTIESNVAITTNVKKTGQTISYYVKDDGDYQKGVTPSYTRDDVKEIVTDHITGLQWQDNTEAKTIRKNWADAQTYCSSLSLDGGEWRLPTIQELQGIVVDGAYNPSIDTTAFVNYETSDYYWSSTTNADGTSYAWIVGFYNGRTDYYNKTNTDNVRCVR